MTKSDYAAAVDQIQRALRPMMTARGYKVRGRTFNRQTEDGLTQVVNLQMGPSDPPGTTYVPGLRENLHGLFTITSAFMCQRWRGFMKGAKLDPGFRNTTVAFERVWVRRRARRKALGGTHVLTRM